MYQIDKRLSDRINIIKIIAIIMVVFIHSYAEDISFADTSVVLSTPNWLSSIKIIISQVISRIAVPLFFLISSFLLYKKEFRWKDNTVKKIKTILLPYLIWNTLWIIIYAIAQSLSFTAPYFSSPDKYIFNFGIEQWIDAYFGIININTPFVYPLWFLRDLFILNCFSVVIKCLVDKFPKIVLSALIITWFANISIPIMEYQSIVFFILGYYIVKYQLKIDTIDNINGYLISAIYVIFIFLDLLFGSSIPIIHKMCVCIGIVAVIKLSNLIVNSDKIKTFFLKISKYTFIIYAFHEMNLRIFRKLVTKILPQTSIIQLAEYIFIPIIIISGCILFGYLLNKYLHKFYIIATGSR